MMTKQLWITVALAGALTCALPAESLAQGRGRGHAQAGKAQGKKHDDKDRGKDDKDRGKKAKAPDTTADRAIVIDRDAHVRVIHEYARAGSLPPGLAKREQLPPGLRAQLRERGRLPPGLQKRLIVVPQPLVARLPPVPSYYHRYFAGDDLIVVDSRRNEVVAIVPNVWR